MTISSPGPVVGFAGSVPRLKALLTGSNGRLPEAPSPLDNWKQGWKQGSHKASPLQKHLRSQTQQLRDIGDSLSQGTLQIRDGLKQGGSKIREGLKQGGSKIRDGFKQGGSKIRDGLKQGRSKIRNGLKQGKLRIRNRLKHGRIKIRDCLNHGSYRHKTETASAQKPSKCFFNSTHHFCLSQAPSEGEIDFAKQFGSVFLQVPLTNLPKDPENWARISVDEPVLEGVDDQGVVGDIRIPNSGAPSSFEPISRSLSADAGEKSLTGSQSIAPVTDKSAFKLLSAPVLTTTARIAPSSLAPDQRSISYREWIQPLQVISTTTRSTGPSLFNHNSIQNEFTPKQISPTFHLAKQQVITSPPSTHSSRTPGSTTTRRYSSTVTSPPSLQTRSLSSRRFSSRATSTSPPPSALQTRSLSSRQRSSTSTRTSVFKTPPTLPTRSPFAPTRNPPSQEAQSSPKLSRYPAVPPRKTNLIRQLPTPVTRQPDTNKSSTDASSKTPLTLVFGPFKQNERKTQSIQNYHPSPTRVPLSEYQPSSVRPVTEPSKQSKEVGISKSLFVWWQQKTTSSTSKDLLTGTPTPVPEISSPSPSPSRTPSSVNIITGSQYNPSWTRHPDPSSHHLSSTNPPAKLLQSPSAQIGPSREPPGHHPPPLPPSLQLTTIISKPPAQSARQVLPPKISNPSSIGSRPLPVAFQDPISSPLPLISRSDSPNQASQPQLLASKRQKYSTPSPHLDIMISYPSWSPLLPTSPPSPSPGDLARGMEDPQPWDSHSSPPQAAPLKSSKSLEEENLLPPSLSTMMMIVIVTLAFLLLLLSLIFFLLLHQQKREKLSGDKKVAVVGKPGETRLYQNMFISVSRIYQNQKPRAPTPPPSPLAYKRPPPLPPPSLPMKMEELHTYTNHDFKKAALEVLQNEEIAQTEDHRPSAPPEAPKQNIQHVQSSVIGMDGENKEIQTKGQGEKVPSYSNVKRPKKDGQSKRENQGREAAADDPVSVVNLRETVGGYEEMTEESQTVSVFGPQTVWEKAHLNQQLD